jgi:hypothetical protein
VTSQGRCGFLAGLLVGGLLGLALALVFTPRARERVGPRLASLAGLIGESAPARLARSRAALRARFQPLAQPTEGTAARG